MTCVSVNAVLSESRNNARRDEMFCTCCDCDDNQQVFLAISPCLKVFAFLFLFSDRLFVTVMVPSVVAALVVMSVIALYYGIWSVLSMFLTHLIQHKCHNCVYLCHLIITLRSIRNS